MMPSTVASGITGVETRIAQIQARIDDLRTCFIWGQQACWAPRGGGRVRGRHGGP